MQHFHPKRKTWHITFGTYGTRLHGGDRPTVDHQHNQRGAAFVEPDPQRHDEFLKRLRFSPVYLNVAECRYVQDVIPAICDRGGWTHRVDSAATDHVHVLLDVDPAVHGEKVRRLIKRWIGQALSERWPLPRGATWWAEQGSNVPINDEDHLNNAFDYIFKQRTP